MLSKDRKVCLGCLKKNLSIPQKNVNELWDMSFVLWFEVSKIERGSFSGDHEDGVIFLHLRENHGPTMELD